MSVLIHKFVPIEPNRTLEAAAAGAAAVIEEAENDPDAATDADLDRAREIVAEAEAARPERPFIPKLVGEFEDRDMAKQVIGEGEFAVYESQGDLDPKTGLYPSYVLDHSVKVSREQPSVSMRKTSKV